jgi:hypothetical protein
MQEPPSSTETVREYVVSGVYSSGNPMMFTPIEESAAPWQAHPLVDDPGNPEVYAFVKEGANITEVIINTIKYNENLLRSNLVKLDLVNFILVTKGRKRTLLINLSVE